MDRIRAYARRFRSSTLGGFLLLAVTVSSDDAGTSVLDVIVPGSQGWKTGRTGDSWRYRNADGPGGITRVALRRDARKPGLLKFQVLGLSGSPEVTRARIPVRGTLIVDAPLATTGQRGETQYDDGGAASAGRGARCAAARSGSTRHARASPTRSGRPRMTVQYSSRTSSSISTGMRSS